MTTTLLHGDCLELLRDVPPGSVDMVLADLPYGRTRNSWDNVIPLPPLWEQLKRVCKDNAAMLFFSQMPFAAELIMSNPKMFKYEWIWDKCNATGFLNCDFAPLKVHENILVFSRKAASFVKNKKNAMGYHPQFTSGKPYTVKQCRKSANYDCKWMKDVETKNIGRRYPTDIIKFPKSGKPLHPTQKPIALLEYLIKTYTNPGETVLDPTMGSGSTGVAAVNTGRNFVGMELDAGYFDIAQTRIEEARRNHYAET